MAAQAAEIIPLVDLRLLSQAEITSLAASCPNAFDLRRCDDVVVPKIDRSVFNESAGSRKQTYSRLRLAPHKPDPAAPSIVASRRPRGLFSPPPSSSTATPADPSLAEAGNADDDDPGHRENLQIVCYLRQLFAREALAPRTLSVSTPIVAPGNPSSFIGSGSKDPGGSAVAMIVVEDDDRVVMNGKGETVDLVALGQKIDPFAEELRRRTAGLTTEEQLLVYLNELDGQWGSRRRRRKIVDASEFGGHLPKGWKLLLSLKRKEGDIWVYCRRYISPCGKHFSSCKDVSSYILTLLGNPTVLPESVGNNAIVPRPDEMITEYAASAFVQENILKEKPNCSVVAPFSSSSINNEMQIMSSNTVNQHQLSCQQRSLKRRKLGKSIVEGVIMKDGKFECQFCHKMFAERQRYNGHIGAHVRFQGLTVEAMPAEGNSSKLSSSVPLAAVSCGFSLAETKEKICTPEIADELHASANLQHQVESHKIDLNCQGAESTKIAPNEITQAFNLVDAVYLPVIRMEDEKAAEETSVTAANNRVDDYCHKAEETSEASEVKNDKASDEKVTGVGGIEVVKPCVFKNNDAYKSNDVDASNFMIDEPNSARANDHDTSCYSSEIVPDTSKDVQLRPCLEVTSDAPVEVLDATCETVIEVVQNFPKCVSIDCKSSDSDFTVFKPDEILETNNGMVIEGNGLENSASVSIICRDNVVCQSSNEKDASSTAISEIEKHATEQKIDSEKDMITLTDNDSGYFICSGATNTFISNIRENALAGNENSTRKANLDTSFAFPNADIVAKSILPMELNASGTTIPFVNEPAVSNENKVYTFDVKRSMLGEIDSSRMEIERCFNGSIAANEEVDASNSLDVDLTLSSPWIQSSDYIPDDGMTADLYEDGGNALGEKKSSDFDRRSLNAVESSEFVRLSGQDTISLPDHSIGLGYTPGLNNDACPAVHLGWDISLQNSAYELTSICVWCSGEFSHAATSAEEISETLGLICPSCKAKILGM